MTPNDRLLAAIFGAREGEAEEIAALRAEGVERDRAEARALAQAAADACPEWAPIAPAMLWGAPVAVALIGGSLRQVSRFGATWGHAALTKIDLENLEEV